VKWDEIFPVHLLLDELLLNIFLGLVSRSQVMMMMMMMTVMTMTTRWKQCVFKCDIES
jgi:hypothetical protein